MPAEWRQIRATMRLDAPPSQLLIEREKKRQLLRHQRLTGNVATGKRREWIERPKGGARVAHGWRTSGAWVALIGEARAPPFAPPCSGVDFPRCFGCPLRPFSPRRARMLVLTIRARSYRPQFEVLEDRTVPTVTYHGGALMPHVEAQAGYLGADWNKPANLPQTVALDTFVRPLVTGPYMDGLTPAGYRVYRGSADAGRIDPVPLERGSTLSDEAIQENLQAAIPIGLLKPPDPTRLYVVFVQPNIAIEAEDGSVSGEDFLGY